MDLGPYPDFEWSQSRVDAVQVCARRYFYNTYGSWEGWLDHADRELRLAYRLKQLSSLDMVFGNIIHRFAHELANIARAGREPPSISTFERRARNSLNDRWQVSREDFVSDPKQHRMLHSAYYGDGPTDHVIERVESKLQSCIPNLHDLELWGEIQRRALQVAFSHNPDGGYVAPSLKVDGVGVYANPDLILWNETEDTYTIFEWKTGDVDPSDRMQMALYGLYARRNLPGESANGRLVYLKDGSQETVSFTEERIERVVERIRDGIDEMRRYLADESDEEENAPVPKAQFALTENRWSCRNCNFLQLCEEEIRQEGPLPWEDA